MSKRKKFVASSANLQGMSDSIRMVKDRDSRYQDASVLLAYIIPDEDNPRKLLINDEDIINGLSKSDNDYAIKLNELEMIKTLANSIKRSGLINPVTIYRLGENKYQIVAGECRFLAFLYLGKNTIPARIFHIKPNEYELKLIQWEENTKRKDLSLYERLDNIASLLETYKSVNPDSKLNSSTIREITGLSTSQSEYYYAILRGPEIVRKAIKTGSINSLDKAYFLVSRQLNVEDRLKAMALVERGATLNELRSKFIGRVKNSKSAKPNHKVLLGSTQHPAVVKEIIELFLTQAAYQHIKPKFNHINWDDYQAVSVAFKGLVSTIEKKIR